MAKQRKTRKSGSKAQAPRLTAAAKAERVNQVLKESYERLQRRQNDKAEQILRRAIEELGMEPRMMGNLVAALENQGKSENARAAARTAVERFPEDAPSHNNLGAMLKFDGDLDEARKHFARAIELAPDYADALNNLATLTTFSSEDDELLASLRRVHGLLPANRPERGAMYFSIARALDQLGHTDEAFAHYERGNRAVRNKLRFRSDELTALVDQVIEHQSADVLAQGAPATASDAAPILVVGMPRSGSTLVEQILASHPDVAGVGEVSDLPATLDAHYEDPRQRIRTLSRLDDEALTRIGQVYAKKLERRAPGAKRVVDKFLTNYIHLGTVRRALPGARFIRVTRDPLDNAFACYTTHFTSQVPYVYDVQEIARTMADAERLFGHWKALMPSALYEVSYEALVNDVEGETRRLLEWLGLPWDERCLEFHTTERRVNSASSTQVRRPVYTSSVGRAARYEAHLGPLRSALETHGVI